MYKKYKLLLHFIMIIIQVPKASTVKKRTSRKRRSHHLANTLVKAVHEKNLRAEKKEEDELIIKDFDVFYKHLTSVCRGASKLHNKSDLVDIEEENESIKVSQQNDSSHMFAGPSSVYLYHTYKKKVKSNILYSNNVITSSLYF